MTARTTQTDPKLWLVLASAGVLCAASLGLVLVSCGGAVTITPGSFCDGILNGNETSIDSLYDLDGDGFFDGDPEGNCPNAYPAEQLDCNDADPGVHPAATEETCNETDDDCNAETSDAIDQDGDASSNCVDCDDNDATRSPDFTETVCNDIDDDCDAATIDMVDGDSDGHANCTDCDDENPDIYPGQTELDCNDIDDDCDESTVDDDEENYDGDEATVCGADHIRGNADDDCDDNDATRFPGNPEVCDGIDNDCDWLVPANEDDIDQDTFRACDDPADCNEGDWSVFPGSQACNPGNDSDCDGTPDESDPDSIGNGCPN